MIPRVGRLGARLAATILPTALVLLSFVADTGGQQERGDGLGRAPAVRHALSLEAHSVANGGRSEVTGGSGGLPFTDAISVQSVGDRRVSSNQTHVEISIRNLAATPDHVRVEWFFVAQPVSETPAGPRREIIFHRDAQLLAIPGGKTATEVVSSPEVHAVYERSTTITNIPADQSSTGYGSSVIALTNQQTGLTIRGWMVRLVTPEGAVLAAKGSNQTYENIVANPPRLAGLLAFSGLSEKEAAPARHGASPPGR